MRGEKNGRHPVGLPPKKGQKQHGKLPGKAPFVNCDQGITDALPESWRVPAGARPAIRGDLSSFSANVNGARPVPVGIPDGTRPGAVKCKVYRAGTARASAGSLQGLAGVTTRVYICQDSSLVAWLTQSPWVPGSIPSAADIFSWCTHMHAVTQTVQIRGILMTSIAAAYTAVVAYDRFAPHKNFSKKEKKYVKVVNM